MMKAYLTEFTEYLKPKPGWMPWFIWEWMQKQVLHIDKIVPREKWKSAQPTSSQPPRQRIQINTE